MVFPHYLRQVARAVAVATVIVLLASCAPRAQQGLLQEQPSAAPIEVGDQLVGPVAAEGVDPEVWQQVQLDLAGADLAGKDGPLAKVGFDLALLYREYQAHLEAFTPSDPLVGVVPGEIAGGALVLIEAVAADDPGALLADLEALGAEDASLFGRMVSGRLPILAIERLAALPSLQFARPVTATTEK